MVEPKDRMWADGHDEPVEIDQRALIDKVLARYSGEFTVFRELLQNSDDAESQAVQIHFETGRHDMDVDATTPDAELRCFKPDLTKSVHQWRFMNNGKVFNKEDWNRLRKIAAGSPDEDKIGAFGVGFYSLFSVTEEPFVTSGGEWMGFYWKDNKDRLFVRRGDFRGDQVKSDWTTFHMPLRNPGPIPPMFDLCRFLASSITFMLHLKEIAVYLDSQQLSKFTKFADPPIPLFIPAGFECNSPKKIMRIRGLQSTTVNIKAQIMGWIYESGGGSTASLSSTTFPQSGGVTASPRRASTSPNIRTALGSHPSSNVQQQASSKSIGPLETSESKITLSILSASVDVTLEQKLGAELHRSMKKSPPSTLRYDLVYMGKEGYDASVKEEENHGHHTRSIFQGLRADLEGAGGSHVSIGHRTSQTTGLGGHMAARFIPTVERESIDFVDRHVAIWNKELLYVGGFLARSTYEFQMEEIAKEWAGALKITNRLDAKTQGRLLAKSLHVLKFFSFHPSTPSPQVSGIMEHAFFTCRRNCPLQFISTIGIRDARTVRMPMEKLEFLKGLCVVPQQIITNLRDKTIKSFRRHGFLKDIQLSDIKLALENQPLNEGDAIAWLKWWQEKAVEGQKVHSQYKELLGFASLALTLQGATGAKVIPMLRITSFVHTQASGGTAYIPPDSPLPETVLPYGIARELAPDFLRATCGLKELSIVDWLRYVVTELPQEHPSYDMTTVSRWAERVLMVLSKAWPLLDSSKGSIVEMLKGCTCVPTSDGLKVPKDSYFASADIFHDLPVVEFKTSVLHGRDLDRFLVDLGVQASLPIDCVFDRVMITPRWSTGDLIRFFLDVRSKLTSAHLLQLRDLPLFFADTGDRHQLSMLYEPSNAIKRLQLPVLRWQPPSIGTAPAEWRSDSDFAVFLHDLGLRRYPPLQTLIALCTSPNSSLREIAFGYLQDNLSMYYSHTSSFRSPTQDIYRIQDFSEIAFIPAIRNGKECLAYPTRVYHEPQWGHLGFAVVASTLSRKMAEKLEIFMQPSVTELLTLLRDDPPQTIEAADIWFSIIYGQAQNFSSTDLNILSRTAFIPIQSDQGVVHCSPTQCFLGNPTVKFYNKLFNFVNFQPSAKSFLAACGSSEGPSAEEIVQKLLSNPSEFYKRIGGQESFLTVLADIAAKWESLNISTIEQMRQKPTLLGMKRQKRHHEEPCFPVCGDSCWLWEGRLLRPDEIVVVDDSPAYQMFGQFLSTAPQEDVLRVLYLKLGSQKLSTLVKEEYRRGLEVAGNQDSEIRALILDRLPLFLREYELTLKHGVKIEYDWLKAGNNFQVCTYESLTLTRTLSHTFPSPKSEPVPVSAVVRRSRPEGPLELWIALGPSVNMYEVARSLCQHILIETQATDVLLLKAFLSTNDYTLKRLGFQDRTFNIQQDEETKTEVEDRGDLQLSQTPSALQTLSWGTKWYRKVFGQPSERPLARSYSTPLKHTESPALVPSAARLDSDREHANVTSFQGSTAEVIRMAIQDLHPNGFRDRDPSSQPSMWHIKESTVNGYCDISGRVGDLEYVDTVHEVKIYTVSHVDHSDLANRDALKRFIDLIKRLCRVCGLDSQSIHIFYNFLGDIVAFNRDASLFLNLHFFEIWHDEQVCGHNFEPAFIYWYFILAHEIAHNLVKIHNSEHELYFSAICEKYLEQLEQLLAELKGEKQLLFVP